MVCQVLARGVFEAGPLEPRTVVNLAVAICMCFGAASTKSLLAFLCLLCCNERTLLALQPQKEEGKGTGVLKRDCVVPNKEGETSSGLCGPREPPRIFNSSERLQETDSNDEDIMDLQVVFRSDGNSPRKMPLMPDGMEASHVAIQEVKVSSKDESQGAGKFESLQKSKHQRESMGGFIADAEDGRSEGISKRSQRGWHCQRIQGHQERERWGQWSQCRECGDERAAEVLHQQRNRSRSIHQDSHREPHQGGERWKWRRSQTWAPEQSRIAQKKYQQDPREDQMCRSRVDQVQGHHEEEISNSTRWLQGETERIVRDAVQESPGIPGCSARTQKTCKCRTESHGAGAPERGDDQQTPPGRPAVGDRRVRGRVGQRRERREKVEKPCYGAFQTIQAEERDLRSEGQSHTVAEAAPGPFFKADAWQHETLEELLHRIGKLSPYNEAFCLTLVCLICFLSEMRQLFFCIGLLVAGLMVFVGFGLWLFSYKYEKNTRCRTLCCVKRRRFARRDFVREETSSVKKHFILVLLIWHDLGTICHAENVPARLDVVEGGFEKTSGGIGIIFDGLDLSSRLSEAATSLSTSWTGWSNTDIMALQRPLWEPHHEMRQAAFERNEVTGENDILHEVTALNQQNEPTGFCLMTHALKQRHEGSREMRMRLQHGDDFYDLIFAIRQRWSDVINPWGNAAIIYVIPQPPPATTGGIDCLHLILDGLPRLGGFRNLVALNFEYNDGLRSDVWFQTQRIHGDLSAEILKRNTGLERTCMSEVITCTCSAGLTVFQEGENFQNQDGLCINLPVEIVRVSDFSSLMVQRFHLNRLVAYVYRLGTDEPIFIQMSGVPESQRMSFVSDTLVGRPGEADQGVSSFHSLNAVPEEFRNRDIWLLIQEFESKKDGYVIVMLDVNVFERAMLPGARPADEWREVTYVRKAASREMFLQDAELAVFCRRGESNCQVERNGVQWHENDETIFDLRNGDYFNVAVQSQRTDLPFCVQWEQAQQGVQLQDMVDTRRNRKRPRGPDEASSYSSDSSTLLQVDKSLGRHFGREKRERLSPPGNGVKFDSEVSVFEKGSEKKVKDRSVTNSFIAEFCETRTDEPLNEIFLEFVKKVRFKDIDETSSENQCSQNSEPCEISLEELLPIQKEQEQSLEGIAKELQNDPAARYSLRQDWETIEGLHPVVQRVLEAQKEVMTGTVIRMHIFLDGSAYYQDGFKKAAWSFVIGLEHDNVSAPNCKIVGFTGAPLAPCTLSDFHIGEETCDSGEAECEAMFWAGLWLLSWGRNCAIETVVHGDNLSTVQSSIGEWKCPPTAGKLHEKCRCLWQRLEIEGFPVSLRHLHGHKGHPGNEAADSVAKYFASTANVFSGLRTRWAKKLALHDELQRLWWHRESEALALFGSERFFNMGRGTQQVHEVLEGQDNDHKWARVDMSLVSMNVFSGLDKGASMTNRRRALAMQADSHGWKVIALQETRFKMSISKKDDLYYMFTASATKAGFYGCEIWLSKRWQIAGRMLKQQDIFVLLEEPTVIAIAVNHPSLQADFISVHAPQKQSSQQEEWWKKLSDFMEARIKRGRQIFLLGDMNARVGSSFSSGIGRLAVQEERPNGRCLRKIVDDFQLILPSTFHEYHEGTSHTFQKHRLDYIAVPSEWRHCIQRSEVAVTFDMMHCKDDHKPVTLDMCFAINANAEKKRPNYDKAKACDPSNATTLAGIFQSFPEPAWEVSTDEHGNALSRHIFEGLCEAFPLTKAKCQPRSPYIKGQLWDLVLERKRLRTDIQEGKKGLCRLLLAKCLCAWKRDSGRVQEIQMQEALNVRYGAFLVEILNDSSKRIQKAIKADKTLCLQETLANLESAFRTKDNKSIFTALRPYQNQNAKRKLKTPRPLPFLVGDLGVVESQAEWHQAWESHWARIEGACIIPWQTHQENFTDNKVSLHCQKDDILKASPTMLMVEQAVRGIKKGKAGGIDGICPDAVKLAGAAAARCIFTLATKELVRGQVPLADRGGIALPLYKCKGPQSARSSFRSIVLENCIGKTVARMFRPELELAFRKLANSAQGGAKKGMGPITHLVRAKVMQRRAFLSGMSFGITLLDMESAFYKAVRQLVVRSEDFEPTDEYVAHISKHLGIGPEEHKIFYSHLRATTMLEKAEANKAVQRWILSSMEGSWCKMRGSMNCLATSLGTKPGDPTADVLYSFVMTRFLRTIEDHFANKPELGIRPQAMTWVDDLIMPFQSPASELLSKACGILTVLHDTATSMGMSPNLKRGKTEVVLGFAGQGAQHYKRQFESDEPVIRFPTKRGLKSVEEAVYLGGILESKGHLTPEIVSCTGRAYSSVRSLKTAVLCNGKIEMKQRRAVLQSLALSKSNYTIGAWLPMRKSEEKTWKAKMMKIIRLLVKTWHGAQEHLSDDEILVRVGLISPREMISVETLRLCGMLAQWADDDYLEPFVSEHSSQECTWMACAVKEANQLGRKTGTGWKHFENFEDMMNTLKGPKAQKNMSRCIKKYTKALLHERFQLVQIHKQCPKKGLKSSEKEGETHDNFPCRICNKVFDTKAALGVHNFQMHGYFCEAYRFAATSICLACLGQYHSRERLVRHLQWGSMGCLEKVRKLVEPLTRDQVLYLNGKDKEQIQESKRQGKRHANQTRTFCRGGVSDIDEIVGNWDEYFAEENMEELERAELRALEDWVIEGPLPGLFEQLPDPEKLEETLDVITKMACRLDSTKVVLQWLALLQDDLFIAYEGECTLDVCRAAWAKARQYIVDRLM